MTIYYHGSDQMDLNIIKPKISTHGKKYVYATKYKNLALIFLSRWNDFLLTLGTNIIKNNLKITLVERHKNIIKDVFQNKNGTIYTLESDNFKQIPDMWEFEYISEKEEIPIKMEIIENILDKINELKFVNEIEIYYYPNRPQNIPENDYDMVEKTIELYKHSKDINNVIYCIKKFPQLKGEIVKIFNKEFEINL